MALRILGYAIALSLPFCLYLIVKKHLALKNSDQFTGSVIGYERHSGGRGGPTYALKVEYRDNTAKSRIFVARGASSPPARTIGAKVIVFQHPDDSVPDILVFESIYLGLWIWLCAGVCVVGCFLAPFVLSVVYGK